MYDVRSLETDENGMLQLPEDFENGRYWMVESVTPNKKDKADKTKHSIRITLIYIWSM